MSDEEASEEELREAEALSVALERGVADDGLPEDALETAALLRHSVDGGELAADREEALLHEVLSEVDRIAARRAERAPAPSGAPLWRWLLGFAGVTAVAILALVWLSTGPVQPGATLLPTPDARLLGAGVGRVEDRGEDSRHRALMRDYRGQVYGALSERYDD